MYRNCIYCSADLDGNESLESFPVGRTLAFDSAQGRLWAVCPKCARWNLSPIEERWEAVEQAERLFRDTRMRVQSENIGLARLRDGTRLIRVGGALQGELAAWRYGGTLVQRRKQYLLGAAGLAVAGTAVLGGLNALGMGAFIGMAIGVWNDHQRKRVVYRVPAEASPDGMPRTVRRWHVTGSHLRESAEGELELLVPNTAQEAPKDDWGGNPRYNDEEALVLHGEVARRALSRSLVRVNAKGAKRTQLEDASALLERSTPEEYIRRIARGRVLLGKRKGMADRQIQPGPALALEMALHEEEERRALEGELAVLEAAWKEAEAIARIADRLALPTNSG